MLILESATSGFRDPSDVRLADLADLPSLRHLLASGEHGPRLQSGDLCVFVGNDEGQPVGIQWVNVNSHQDQFLGQLPRPEGGTAYINQTFVDASARGCGYGRRLMVGTLGLCRQLGISRVRLFVDTENSPMIMMCQSLGFEQTGLQVGLRLGPVTLRQTRKMDRVG